MYELKKGPYYRYGHFNKNEVNELRAEGWRVKRIKVKQYNKNGIPLRV